MLLGFALLYVGAVLFLNGLWLLGRIQDREIVVINIVSGVVTLSVAMASIFGDGADLATVKAGALTLLFTTTYLWVAYNRIVAVDGRGLGWFSLFVSVTAVPVALQSFAGIGSALDLWMAVNWSAWAVLWFMYFLLLALGRPILQTTGMVTLLMGIGTGWIPGFLLLEGVL